MEMEDTQHMENLHTQPDPEPDVQEKSETHRVLSRRERRLQEKLSARQEKENLEREKKMIATSVKQLQENIGALLKIYADGYNEYAAQNPGNSRKLLGLQMPWNVNKTSVSLTEIATNVRNPDLSAYDACMNKDLPGQVNVMYLRVDMTFHLASDTNAVARPGVPEEVKENADGTKYHTQLFYHAICPLISDTDEHVLNVAKEKLLADLMVHIFCMGVDMQQMNNNNQWQGRLNQQTDNINKKVEEVNEIFSHIGENREQAEMKVS